MDMNTTQVKGNCVLHVRQDSDTDLEHLFNSVLNKDAPSSRLPSSSIPLRMRNLPPSFFQPSIGGGAPLTAGPQHMRSRSLPADIGQMTQQQDPNLQQQQPQQRNFMIANHQRKHSHDALESNGTSTSSLPTNWEERTTAVGQKYYINHRDRTTSWQDPRKSQSMTVLSVSPQQTLPALPEHWEQAVTPEGDIYFINHADQTTSWFDPRIRVSNSSSPTPQITPQNVQYFQADKRQRQQRLLEQREFLLQQQRMNSNSSSGTTNSVTTNTNANNTTNTNISSNSNSTCNSPQMDPLLNNNSMLNNLVRSEKFANQQINANVGIHGRVESVDSGLDGMGSFLTPNSSDVDAMGSMEDVDMEGNQPLTNTQFSNAKDGGQMNTSRLPEFFDTMQGTNVDLGILEGETEITPSLDGMNSEVLNDVDMILNSNNKGEGFLTWL